jgi:o-succinylbenzoate---CoA ligase
MNAHLLCPISRAAATCFQHPALIYEGKEISYGELNHLIAGLKVSLEQKGIGKNDKVAFVAHLMWETIVLFFALFRLQAIACPLSPRTPPPKMKEELEQLNADHFLEIATIDFRERPAFSIPLLHEEQLATFLFTSGSNGKPKIACHSLGNHVHNAQGVNAALELSHQDRWLLCIPLYHIAALAILFRCFLATATVVLPPVSYDEVTFISLVPTQLYRLNVPIKATILVGGAPFPPVLYKKGYNVIPTYGLTEMSSTVFLEGYPPLPHAEVYLGKDNEILVRGTSLFQGYYSNGNIQRPVDSEGWFATGDLGIKTTENSWHIVGRKDNLFFSGGENIQPEEIEAALLSLPHIIQAMVVPIESEEFGARPIAFIDDANAYTLESLHRILQEKLPRFKLPTRLLPFPEDQSFKPSRRRLKEFLKDSGMGIEV